MLRLIGVYNLLVYYLSGFTHRNTNRFFIHTAHVSVLFIVVCHNNGQFQYLYTKDINTTNYNDCIIRIQFII